MENGMVIGKFCKFRETSDFIKFSQFLYFFLWNNRKSCATMKNDMLGFKRGERKTIMRVGFDNEKYLQMQSEHIEERINKFGDKLYLDY